MIKTKVINLFGGPGIGKSTVAAHVYAHLKMEGMSAELVTEYAKDKVWEGSLNVLRDQIYVFAKQRFRLGRVKGKVEYVVTDAPLLLSMIYGRNLPKPFYELVLSCHHEFDNLNIVLNRRNGYSSAGRLQDEEAAISIDKEILPLLDGNMISYHFVNADLDATRKIEHIIESIYEG